jgi:uncharacterized protein (DUF2062 family)
MKIARPRAFRRRRMHPLRWRRRWRILVLDLLGREESPDRVAAAIGLGVGIGFSPFVGTHLLIALALAVLLRLNKIDTLLGTLAGQVPTWGVVFPLGYRLGHLLLRHGHRLRPMNLHALLQCDISCLLHPMATAQLVFGRHAFMPRLTAFLVGTTILAILLGLAAFFVARSILELYHRRHPRVAERAAKRRSGKFPKPEIPEKF